MARPRRPTAVVELAALERAIASLPVEAARWARSAHRKAFQQWKDRGGFMDYGLKRRFDIKPWSDMGKARVGGGIIRPSGQKYPFSPRRRQIGVRGEKGKTRAGKVSTAGVTPSYVYSGSMREELMRRRPRRVKAPPGEVRTRFSLFHRSLNLMGQQHGIERIDRIKQPITYMMTVYHDSVNRTGARKQQVTRSITIPRIIPSATSFAQEWQWQPQEIEQIRRESEMILQSIVRGAAFDKNGNLRAKYDRAEADAP
jgi:hypothetical protein